MDEIRLFTAKPLESSSVPSSSRMDEIRLFTATRAAAAVTVKEESSFPCLRTGSS